MRKLKITTKDMTFMAIFAALTGILSQLSIPLPFTPVPVNLATLSVLLAGGLLGARRAGMSQLVYVLVGAIGLPIFSNFSGGVGILVGPTGGYIIGYVVGAFLIGLLLQNRTSNMWIQIGAMVLGMFVCYAVGTAWFMFSTKRGLVESLGLCVFPFLIGDAIKIAIATFLVRRLKRFV